MDIKNPIQQLVVACGSTLAVAFTPQAWGRIMATGVLHIGKEVHPTCVGKDHNCVPHAAHYIHPQVWGGIVITVVQLRVLRKMVGTNVMILGTGGAYFRGEQSGTNVREQTIRALVKKGMVKRLKTDWCGTEYQITDKGREAAGELVDFALIRRLVKDALDKVGIIQEIAERTYMVCTVVDIPTIREKADEVLRNLLTVDVILSGEGSRHENTGSRP